MLHRALALLLLTLHAGQESDLSCADWLKSPTSDREIALRDVPKARKALWDKYVAEVRADKRRKAEHEARAIKIGDLTMKFASTPVGEKPGPGWPLYIALHGGGQADPSVNDSQWDHMKVYYRESVKAGLYVAPRGMTDTWNLHFVDASYPAYDRLIENFIAFESVDPNRVYLLGFSAGGDGTYAVAPRMADRWAAANMSAGHPNGVSPVNLMHVPFLVQVGEKDTAYDRHKAAATFFVALGELRAKHPAHYVHAASIHAGRPHNFLDNHPKRAPQRVIKDPAAWLKDGAGETEERDTNAISWLDAYVRPPLPPRVVWDLTTTASTRGVAGRRHYWLDLGDRDPAKEESKRISVRLDKKTNGVIVEECGPWLRVLLTDGMLDCRSRSWSRSAARRRPSGRRRG